jgi:hypothetical protein
MKDDWKPIFAFPVDHEGPPLLGPTATSTIAIYDVHFTDSSVRSTSILLKNSA